MQAFILQAKLLNGTCQIVLFQVISRTRTLRRGIGEAATHSQIVYYLWPAHDPQHFDAGLSLSFIQIPPMLKKYGDII